MINFVTTRPPNGSLQYLTRLGPLGLILHEADQRTRIQVVETVRAAFDHFAHGAVVRLTAAYWMGQGPSAVCASRSEGGSEGLRWRTIWYALS